MQIKIKKMHPDATLPKRATDGSAGFDLTSVSCKVVNNERLVYSTGLAFEIPRGYAGLLLPRSSICKTALRLSNSVGLLDCDYRGEVTFVFDRKNELVFNLKTYAIGERIGQIVFIALPQFELVEATELGETARGAGGYGSTGK